MTTTKKKTARFNRAKGEAAFRKADKIWKLLRIALVDLAWAERSKKYVVDLCYWHFPNSHCKVCLAGSVIARTLGAKPTDNVSPSDYNEDQEIEKRLLVLNELAFGYIGNAVRELGADVSFSVRAKLKYVDLPNYDNQRDEWWGAMNAMAKQLKQLDI